MQTVIDSSHMNGLGIHLHQSVQMEDHLYHFGGLYRYDYTDFGLIVRKTDKNLNLIQDTNLIFSNRAVWVNSAVVDSSNILITGCFMKAEGGFSALFLLRMDTALNLLDTSLFDIPFLGGFYPVIHIQQDDLFLKVTNYHERISMLLRFDRITLAFKDTVFAFGLSWDQPVWLINPYGAVLDSNNIISPYELVRNGPSTTHSSVGWIKWNLSGQYVDPFFPFEPVLPFQHQIVPSRIGTRSSSILLHDTLIQIYAHNLNEYTYPPNDSSIMAMMFCDMSGNLHRITFIDSGYYFMPENLIRFNNGNYLATARKQTLKHWPTTGTYGFMAWLLNSKGEVIQRINLIEPETLRVQVYPNPATSEVNFSLDQNTEKISTIELYDMQGRKVAMQQPNNTLATLHIAHLPNGIYIARVSLENRVITRKVVKR